METNGDQPNIVQNAWTTMDLMSSPMNVGAMVNSLRLYSPLVVFSRPLLFHLMEQREGFEANSSISFLWEVWNLISITKYSSIHGGFPDDQGSPMRE